MDIKEIDKSLERLFVPINNKLDALTSKTEVENSMQICGQKIAHVEERVERVHGELNDLAQYVRRLDLRIFGVSISCCNEKAAEDWALQYSAEDLAISLPADAIERAHCIGKGNGGKVQVIVRFNSWKSRCLVHLNRKKGKFPICVDLTQENQSLYKKVRGVVLRNPDNLAFSLVYTAVLVSRCKMAP